MKTEPIGTSQNIQRIKTLIINVSDKGLNAIIYGDRRVGKDYSLVLVPEI
jgi:hypothetical protein